MILIIIIVITIIIVILMMMMVMAMMTVMMMMMMMAMLMITIIFINVIIIISKTYFTSNINFPKKMHNTSKPNFNEKVMRRKLFDIANKMKGIFCILEILLISNRFLNF